jgi:hypothetical protein
MRIHVSVVWFVTIAIDRPVPNRPRLNGPALGKFAEKLVFLAYVATPPQTVMVPMRGQGERS